MANDHTADAYRGLLVLDPHWGWAKLNAEDSTFDQVSPYPAVPVDQGSSRMVLSSPGGVRTSDLTDYVLTQRGGFPGRSTRSAGFVVSDTDPDDPDNVDAGVDYRGWWPPNVITAWDWPDAFSSLVSLGATYVHPNLMRTRDGKYLVATVSREFSGDSDVIYVALAQEDGSWFLQPGVGREDTVHTSAARQHSCVCDMPDGRWLLAYYVWDAAQAAYQLQTKISSDQGESWQLMGRYALEVSLDDTQFVVGRIRMKYSNGQILLVQHVTFSNGEGLVQWASDDDGATFTRIYTFDTGANEEGALPEIFVTSSGGFFVIYFDSLNNEGFKTRRIASAFDSMGDVDADTVTNIPDDGGTDMSGLAAWDGEDGIWYFFALYGAAGSSDGITMRSVDEGLTWSRMESGVSSTVADGAWRPGDDAVTLTDFSFSEWRGQTIGVSAIDTSETSDLLDDALISLTLGGHSTLALPYSSYTSVDASHLAWVRTWIGIVEPDTMAPAVWTEFSAGSPVVTFDEEGMDVDTTSDGITWSADLNYSTDRELIGLFTLRVNSGGSLSASNVAARIISADGTHEYGIVVRFTTTGFRCVDQNGGATLADVTTDMTRFHDIVIAVGAGEGAVYYRDCGTEGGTPCVDREWTLAYQGSITDDMATPATDGSIAFGNMSTATANATYKQAHAARGTIDDVYWIAFGQTNPDDLHPRPYSANAITLPSGARLQARNGPTVGEDRWNIGTRYTMGVENLDPRLSPDPRRKWRSATGTDQVLSYDLSPIPGSNVEPGARSYGVCILGFDGARADLEGYDEDGATWVTIAGGGTYGEIGALAFTREGDTLRVDDTNGNNSTTEHYFSRGALKGAHLRLNPGGINRHVVNSYEGHWNEDSTTKWPVLQFDADDSEPTDGTLTVGFGDLVLIGHDVGRFSKLRVRLYFANETDTHDFVEAGIVLPGPVLLFGRDYSRGRVVTGEVDTTITERRGGATVTKQLAPKRMTVAFAWDEGVDEYELDSGTAPSYITADGAPVGVRADVGRILDGLIAELGGANVPCVYLPNVPSDTVAGFAVLTPLDGFVYGRITGPVRREAFLGDEGVDERVRVATITIRGEVGGMATTVWPERELYVSPYAEELVGEAPLLILLAHMDGADASTTWTDDGDYPLTFSPTGATQQDTAQSKWGTASTLFNGSGRLGVFGPAGQLHPVEFDIGPSENSIFDFWIRPTAYPPTNPEHLFGYEKNGPNWWALQFNTDGTVSYVVTLGSSTVVLIQTTTAAPLNQWSHVVVSRHDGVTTIGIAGELEDSAADTTDYTLTAGGALGNAVIGGSAVSGDPFHGWIDEVRYKYDAYLDATTGPYAVPTSAYYPP